MTVGGFLQSIETIAGQTIGILRENGQVEDCFVVDPASIAGPVFLTLTAGDTAAAGAANTAALEAAAVSGASIILPPGDYYFDIGSTPGVICQLSGVTDLSIAGSGRDVTRLWPRAGADGTFFNIVGASQNVSITALTLDGRKADNPNSYGITAAGASDTLSLNWCRIRNCAKDGARFTSCTNVDATNNDLISNGGHGLTGDSLEYFNFSANHARSNGLDGIGGIGPLAHGVIEGNECHGNGFTAPFADQITAYNAANHHVAVTGNSMSGGGNNGMHLGGSYLSVHDNVVDGAPQYGIQLANHDATASVGHSVSGNIVSGCTQSGFWLSKIQNSSFEGNTSAGNSVHGFFFDTCVAVSGQGNVATGNLNAGARVASCTSLDIGGIVRSNGTHGLHSTGTSGCTFRFEALSNTNVGIYCPSTTTSLFVGCKCSGNASGFSEDPGADNNVIASCDFTGNTSDTPFVQGTGTQWRSTKNGGTANIASAAATALWAYTDRMVVTGNTTITSLTGNNWAGRVITLIFTSALTVTDGGNLVLAGNFVTTADDTLTLIGDGTNWNEVARSVN